MQFCEILTAHQVSVAGEQEGVVATKAEALLRLATLLAAGVSTGVNGRELRGPSGPTEEIARVLVERERLQSTGVGGGVAIPHGVLEGAERQVGAVLLCPRSIDFEAIDGAPVSILCAVIGPTRATGEHLKMLARISRLLRDAGFRERLLAARNGKVAFEMIVAEERRGVS
ncbi:PTS sugar transporter subunit IIA [Chondromyces apiculatus]|uniref:PTS IIA-like nitrogen-regulatory protein PtsN n=1 Tax=Chondromyces apiculatus DSM 436 TaxID=1192034 RepID=A0A017TIE8_9BACT|nr:PTS sugar transporter subunit IIA [Chondromyces apiculatus]EYF08610.1 PTS IIA-like nitrogen-regulatory protein PtsN [Chondromyces apiculatus DSM 436]